MAHSQFVPVPHDSTPEPRRFEPKGPAWADFSDDEAEVPPMRKPQRPAEEQPMPSQVPLSSLNQHFTRQCARLTPNAELGNALMQAQPQAPGDGDAFVQPQFDSAPMQTQPLVLVDAFVQPQLGSAPIQPQPPARGDAFMQSLVAAVNQAVAGQLAQPQATCPQMATFPPMAQLPAQQPAFSMPHLYAHQGVSALAPELCGRFGPGAPAGQFNGQGPISLERQAELLRQQQLLLASRQQLLLASQRQLTTQVMLPTVAQSQDPVVIPQAPAEDDSRRDDAEAEGLGRKRRKGPAYFAKCLHQVESLEDAGCAVKVSRVSRLGNDALQVLRNYFSGFGPVRQILEVFPEGEKPSDVVFVVMARRADADRVLERGRIQEVRGKQLKVQQFSDRA